MKRFSFFCILLTICFLPSARAQNSTDIVFNKKAPHIAGITADSVFVASGSTYSFTVDTPEDKGLHSTTPDVKQLLSELTSKDGSSQTYQLVDKNENQRNEGLVESGDKLYVTSADGTSKKVYYISLRPMALTGHLKLERENITANTTISITLYFTAGQRSPNTTVRIFLPEGIKITPDNTTVNVIGRGDVKLKDLATQSMGRLGTNYPYKKVGNFAVSKKAGGGSVLLFKHLDLRPYNGADLKIVISNVHLSQPGKYTFKAVYQTKEPEVLTSAGTGSEIATLNATPTISDFKRVIHRSLPYKETPATYTTVNFKWSKADASGIRLMQSLDEGRTWKVSQAMINTKNSTATVAGLHPNQLYTFKLVVNGGVAKGSSNIVQFYSGKMNVKRFGALGDGKEDATDKINKAIAFLNQIGGGTLWFSDGIYNVRTVHLQSNVYLYVSKGSTIRALKGGDAPETTWYSDRKYRSGLSPSDPGPYKDPENWLTKQDVGHHYFRNAMFFGERLDNVKIIGNGRITGDGNLVTGDKVMNNPADNRCDKMFALKLCTHLEIGGLYRPEDLWYDEKKDEPYYITKNNSKDFAIDNMLHIDRSGHFVLLATGTDNINVHDTYIGKNSTSNVRDIYDFMECNKVAATNIYCKESSDDIIKPGSDCSLGFTRPAKHFRVRNIIGDTNCNLFQIGSETADDITDVFVDNIYVLGANKAGFSISTNDGGLVKNIYLNCGYTGKLHSRSKMLRTQTPFFISISNRGRILGASASRFQFTQNGEKHDELLVTNVSIGHVDNIVLNGVDISEVYGGSSFRHAAERWKPYDSKQRKATPIVAGYALPDPASVEGGLNFKLPDGKHTGYVKNIVFNDIHVLVKGGNPVSDTAAAPPELGVGQYNVTNLKVQPSYGLWARHVQGLTIKNSSFNYEKEDHRYAIYLDDVTGAKISGVKMMKPFDVDAAVKLKNASDVTLNNVVYYSNEWGKSPVVLSTTLSKKNKVSEPSGTSMK
jgi:polygalacturonase